MCVLSYLNKWIKSRAKLKASKEQSLKDLERKFKKLNFLTKEEFDKLKELIEIYLDAHDFTTHVGSEISKLADKSKP